MLFVQLWRGIGDPKQGIYHRLISVGTLGAALFSGLSCLILFFQLGSLKDDLRRQLHRADRPMLTFGEVPVGMVERAITGWRLRVQLVIANQGTGLARECSIYYVEDLPSIGFSGRAALGREQAEQGVSDDIEAGIRTVLSDYSLAEDFIKNAMLYQESERVSRVSLALGTGKDYTLVAERDLGQMGSRFTSRVLNMYCAVFYVTDSGDARVSTIWYQIEVTEEGAVHVTPKHTAYAEK